MRVGVQQRQEGGEQGALGETLRTRTHRQNKTRKSEQQGSSRNRATPTPTALRHAQSGERDVGAWKLTQTNGCQRGGYCAPEEPAAEEEVAGADADDAATAAVVAAGMALGGPLSSLHTSVSLSSADGSAG